MSVQVITAKPDMLVTEVAELLHKHSFSGLPVVSDAGTVMGMITERDFLASKSQIYLPTYIKLLSQMDYIQGAHKGLPYVTDQLARTKAQDIMNTHVLFARPGMTLEEVAEIFASRGNNPIAVTDEHNKLIGIIARSDLLKPLVRHTEGLPEGDPSQASRLIDEQVQYVASDFSSRFAYVAKARANIWFTTAIVLFLVGFIGGVIYVVDPQIFRPKNENPEIDYYDPGPSPGLGE
jgi:CBS domain-containing protein